MQINSPWSMNDGFAPQWLFAIMICGIVTAGVAACSAPVLLIATVGFISTVISVSAAILAVLQSRSSIINDRDIWGNYDKLQKFNTCPHCGSPSVVFNMGITGNKQYVEYECMSRLYLKKATKHMIMADKFEPGVPGICEPNTEDTI